MIGTITFDEITYESGQSINGLGGVLYQAAVLCGLGEEVHLHTNMGQELADEVEATVSEWSTLCREFVRTVPGHGNQVRLHYPESGERMEVLKSVVPPLDPAALLKDIRKLAMIILVINSGFDVELRDWQKIVHSASCPIWIDIHSLALSRKIGVLRNYRHIPDWKEWTEGVNFIQANAKEVASMLGQPDRKPSESELKRFAARTFELGVRAVFITLGREGVLVMTPGESRKISISKAESVVDTTGCGDVFCSATAVKLSEGENPFNAAYFGLELATKAVAVKGITETYCLAQNFPETKKGKRKKGTGPFFKRLPRSACNDR